MDRLQRNAGTAGVVAGALVVVLLILFFSISSDPQAFADPAKALPLIDQKIGLITVAVIVRAVAVALVILFTAGLFSRLRERAPTRATAQLYFAVVGLAAFGLAGMLQWLGGDALAAYRGTDQVAASHAYLALDAVVTGLEGFGNAFAGAALVIAGWAVIATGAIRPTAGWVAVVAGTATLATIFTGAGVIFLASLLLSAIWLVWAGSEMRR